jgi:hypothetical protein
VPDSIKILAEQIDDQIEASTERCIAASESLIGSTELIALSRESIQRSRAQIRRITRLLPPKPGEHDARLSRVTEARGVVSGSLQNVLGLHGFGRHD